MLPAKIGAYFQVYKNNWKPDFTLKHFREHYPDSPVYLLSDAGDDFSSLSEQYLCMCEYSDFNTGLRGGYTLREMIEWFSRLKRCFEFCDTDYIIYLEDVNSSKPIVHFGDDDIQRSVITSLNDRR